MKEKEKKPITKKWWFWAIIAVVIIGIAAPKDKKAPESNESKDNAVSSTVESRTE